MKRTASQTEKAKLDAALHERKEALEQQAATADILKIISRSAADVQPVFDAIAKRAKILCGAHSAFVSIFDGELLHLRSFFGTDPKAADTIRAGYPLKRGTESAAGRAVLRRRTVQIPDVLADPEYTHKKAARMGGWRSSLAVPMLRDGQVVGAIAIARAETGKFPPAQIKLLQTFADQAAIAIENARLFNETQDALERQIATAEVLKVISGSPSDVQPVFEAIVKASQRLIAGKRSILVVRRGTEFVVAAESGAGMEGVPTEVRTVPLDREANFPSRAILDGEIVHIPDWQGNDVPPFEKLVSRSYGVRSGVIVPLLLNGAGIGALGVGREAPGAYGDKEISLLRSFADQAVIAIENARLFNETKEALERQTATGEVLRIVSQSMTDARPVFEAILGVVRRLFATFDATVWLVEGDALVAVARDGPTVGRTPGQRVPITHDYVHGLAVLECRPMCIDDVPEARNITEVSRADLLGRNRQAILMVPLVREGKAIGALSVSRATRYGFSGRQVEMLESLADQAVIAIENVRLFTELESRNKDLGESLEQQKASGEILGTISSSIADTKPVFDKILRSCERLFAGRQVGINLLEADGKIRIGAYHGPGREQLERLQPFAPGDGSGSGAAIQNGRLVHYPDAQDGADTPEATRRGCRAIGVKAVIFAPMMWQGRAIGVIFVGRDFVGSFSEKEISLLKTFADQAVIAIQNARLFYETKEALEQQTATADILKVISSSPTDVQPVFEAIVHAGIRLFENAAVAVARPEGDEVRLMAIAEHDPALAAKWKAAFPFRIGHGFMHGAAMLDRTMVEMDDALVDDGRFAEGRRNFAATGYRAMTVVPMIKDGAAVGTISVVRVAPGPLGEKERSLLRTFANQAVIAIENVRLFNETKEALERQTATADILRVISSSPTNVQPVFDMIQRNAVRLTDAQIAAVFRFDGELVHLAATHNWSREALDYFAKVYPSPPSPNLLSGRTILGRAVVRIADAATDPHYDPSSVATGHWRRMVGVPVLREGRPLGALVVSWRDPGDTPQQQVDLLQTFADQAAIAIENVRLFKELEARNKDLGESLEQQQASSEILATISNSIADTQPVFDKIVQSCARLFNGYFVGIGVIKEDGLLHAVAYHGPNRRQFEEAFPIPVDENSATGRAIAARDVMHYPDVFGGENVPPNLRRSAEKVGGRSVTVAPMLWEERGVGGIFLAREFAAPYSEKEIRQLKTFADQAVIAIQNARLFREIAEKSRQLEEASQHKSQFLASMSHELRTPLNAILGFNEMIIGEVYGEVPGDMHEPLKDIQTSGKHLLRLINNVLDLAKIEAGRMELALADYSVQEMVESVRTTLRPLAAEKGLEFIASVPTDLPLAHGDGGRLTQCLMNLAGNSLKFTKAGRVEIGVAQENGRIRFHVADTGIGIPQDKIAGLFTEFKQTDATVASEYGGTGLGLSITRKFVEMHGGRIWVESAVGQGSKFLFEVPLRVGA